MGLADCREGIKIECFPVSGVAFVAGDRVLAEGYGSPIDPHKAVS